MKQSSSNTVEKQFNKWQHVPYNVVSFAEQIHYDGLTNDIIREWANDSFKMRGVTFDGKFWRVKAVPKKEKS
jgi:hypothetical protein